MLVPREYQYGTFENMNSGNCEAKEIMSLGTDKERLNDAYDCIEKLEYRIVELENKIKEIGRYISKQV